MTKVKRCVCLGLLVLPLLMREAPVLGDDNQDQAAWDQLKQLSTGQPVRVEQKDTKRISGNFRSLTDEAMVLSTAAGEQTISRQSVLRVSYKVHGHRMRNSLIGLGIGAGAGAGVGAAAGGPRRCTGFCIGPTYSRAEAAGILSAVGAVVGAIIGAIIPTGGWHEVYHARQPG